MTELLTASDYPQPVAVGQPADKAVVKGTLLVASTLPVMVAAIIAPSLPAMRAHFVGVEQVDLWVRLVLTLPALLIAVGAPLAGLIVDRFGRKNLLLGSTLLYGLAGGSGYVLPSLFAILAGRALVGLAVAGVMTSVTTLIADYYSGAARARLLGFQVAFMGLSGVVFTTTGGILADLDWRNPFLIYLLALPLLPFIMLALFEPLRPSQPPVGAVPAAQKSSAGEKVPLKLLAVVYGATFLAQGIFYLIPVQLPFYLGDLMGATARQSGLAIAVMAFCFSVGSLLSPRLSQTFSRVAVISLSFGVVGLGYSIVGLVNSYSLILTGLAFGGLGFGFLIPNLNVWLAAEAPAAIRGRALGGLTTFAFLGQFLSPLISQPVIERIALAQTYLLVGGLLVVLAVSAALIVRLKR